MTQKSKAKKTGAQKKGKSTKKTPSDKKDPDFDEGELKGIKQKGVIKQGTIAEFMRKRTQLVGFDIGFHKHTQYMAEFVDNALDAIEVGNWKYSKMYRMKEDFYFEYPKPKESLMDEDINAKNLIIRMRELLEPIKDIINTEPLVIIRLQEIEKPEMLSDEQAGDTRMFSFEVFDNGIGLVPPDLEKFGLYLASSKSEQLKQTRGSQGFGASSAFSDAQNTTGRPVTVISRHIDNQKATVTTFFTTSKNEKDYTIEPSDIRVPFQHGTYVRLNYLNRPYRRGYADEYIQQTSLLNSHISVIFIAPNLDIMVFPRRVSKFPNEPKYAKPHPASSNIGDFKEMLRTTEDTNLITFMEQKFVRMSRERAKKIVENANQALGGSKGILSKKPKELNEKEIRALTRAVNKQTSCLNRLGLADLKQAISESAARPLLDYLTQTFPEIPKKEYTKVLKRIKFDKKTTDALIPEEIELLQTTTREGINCPSLIPFTGFKDLIGSEGERTAYDVLSKEFCKLNYNIARKITLAADAKLKNKTLNSIIAKDLGKRETEVLFKVVSESVETEEIKNKTEFLNLLKVAKNRTIPSFLQGLKGVGKSKATEIIQVVDEKLHYKTLLNSKGNESTNKEKRAIYDSLMEIEKCPAAMTANAMGKLLESATTTSLGTFLNRNFLDINRTLADQLIQETNNQLGGHISLENIPPVELDEDQMNALYKAFISEKYLAPPTDTVVPVGSDILERVIKKHFEPNFVAAETRSPTSGKGLAFSVEVALAYGGKIKDVSKNAADILYRFVNRTPKLRDNSDCVIWKTVSKVNWKNYKIDSFENGIPKGKIRVFVNVSGPFVHVMFKSQSKQALAEDDVLKREIQLALEAAGRKLKSFITGREIKKRKARRAITLLKSVKTFAESLYKIECSDFKTRTHIPGKPSLEEIETALSRPIKDDLKPDVRSVLSEQWASIKQIIEDLGLDTLSGKYVKDLLSEVLDDLSKGYNIIVGASPEKIVNILLNKKDPFTEKLILETLRTHHRTFSNCEKCELAKDKTTCSFYSSENQECRFDQEVYNSFTSELRNNLKLDPLDDEILIDYLGMLKVEIERNQRLNKSVKNLPSQLEQFLEDFKANTSKDQGILRSKKGTSLAFSNLIKRKNINEKQRHFWRILYPKIKSVIPEEDFTIETLLELKFPNIEGGYLTQKDAFVQEIIQYALDDLIDEGIIMQSKKKGVYRRIKKR
ncbi:MAG: hypothetical protein HWN65_12805 [Candidatus Helarchaeota archaeon]|nr:hypothetical protein [Candidatus Helarchaeota archaeon]